LLVEFRQAYPQHAGLTDTDLVRLIHAEHYPEMPRNTIYLHFLGGITHDILDGCAVTGADSLQLLRIAPHLKPSVKMTVKEYLELSVTGQITPQDSILIPGNGTVYLFAPGSPVAYFIRDILNGDDSYALGYPYPGPDTVVVTKTGDILTDYCEIHDHAGKRNLIWGASGTMPELLHKAQKIAEVVKC
jgi:hypothetical protein